MLAAIAVTLYKLNTEAEASVNVTVIVSALPVSFDTKIDLIKELVALGAVYSVVALVLVKSRFAFLNRLPKEPTVLMC